MARWARQILLLVWKNFILQIRRPIGTTFEILLPIAFASLLVVAKYSLSGSNKTYCFNTAEPTVTNRLKSNFYFDPYLGRNLAYFPNNSWTYEIMQNASKRLSRVFPTANDTSGRLFTSEDQLVNLIAAEPSVYFGAIIFLNANSPTIPTKVSYKMRFSSLSYYEDYMTKKVETYSSPWNTGRVYPQFKTDGPGYDWSYKAYFVPLQWAIDKAIIQMQTGQSAWSVADAITRFPYPQYSTDSFITAVQFIMPLVFTIAFVYTAVTMTKELVAEKQSQLKESMKMMGLANWVHWLSWFIKNFVFLFLSCLVLSILLKVSKVFEYGDWSLIFIFFLFYSVSMIFFSFALRSAKAALCLLPNTCLGVGVQVITKMEAARVGVQWSTLNDPPSIDDNFSLSMVFLMMLVQSFMWWVITWYVEAVFPGQYGVSKPFYFFLLPSYWCGSAWNKNSSTSDILQETSAGTPLSFKERDKNVEEADPNLDVGVNIVNLRKMFSSSVGNKVAVDGLSLKMYKGQITALLGHNGAGKTTTMSILTGLYQPSSGTATVGGRSILSSMDMIRDSLGLCPQHNVLFDRLSVQEHLQLFAALKGIKGQAAKIKIDQMIYDLQLVDKRNAKSATLSGGMKRKLSCAIALIGDPDVVFLDEPTSGMDPYARRATWDLLQKYTQNKTVVLTTHFMDEADYLGDRIAIMANGTLRCCGSSLFLKKRFGVGYHLNLVKSQTFQEQSARNVIEDTIPRAKMVSNIGSEMKYILENESSKQFKGLFQSLEAKKDELGIGSFGVSVTTLEEVFLKVGEDSTGALENGDDIEKDLVVETEDMQYPVLQNVAKQDYLYGNALMLSQFRAMFTKRFLNSIRQKRAIISQIILPTVMVLCALILIKVSTAQVDEPPLVLDLSMLSKPGSTTNAYMANFNNDMSQSDKDRLKSLIKSYYDTVRVSLPDKQIVTSESLAIKQANMYNNVTTQESKYTISDSDMKPCCKYRNLVLNKKCITKIYDADGFKILCGDDKTFGYAYCTDCIRGYSFQRDDCPRSLQRTNLSDPLTFFSEYVLRQSNPKLFFRKYSAGLTMTRSPKFKSKSYVTAWYSSEALHTLPAAFNAANNIILRFLTGSSEYGIQVTNHPLPKTTKQKVQTISSSVASLILCIFITMASSFIAASFAPYLVTEKNTKAKHVQFVGGVNSFIYWSASLCWDYINYLVPAIIIVILFAGFNLDAYSGDTLGVIVFLLLLYGLAMLPFVYCLCFMFKSALIAYAIIALVGFLVSMAAVFAVFFCRLPGSRIESTGKALHFIFLFLPTYALPSSIIDLSTFYLLKKSCKQGGSFSVKCKDLPAHSTDVLYPGCGAAIIAMAIQFIVYFALTILIEEGFFIKFRSTNAVARTAFDQEDEDVKNENDRVRNMTPGDICREAVVLQDLSKVFNRGNFKAVDNLSVGIPKRECFGLLGVNGAGKTTTFGMLTGELGITAGTAYLAGCNIQTQLRTVQRRIGYCPQFDALLDKLTGREMLTMFARLRGIPSRMIPEVVNTVIYQLNLADWADKMCGNYSGGNKRKLSTALALVGDPPIIFLDEPTSGMDPISRRFLWNTLSSLLDDERTIILTSHSMEECEALCTRLVIMVNGQFKCLGSIQHLKSRFGQGYTLMVKIGNKEFERRESLRRSRSKSLRAGVEGNSSTSTQDLILPEVNVVGNPNAPPSAVDESGLSLMTQKVKEFIQANLPGSYLMDDRLGMLHYQILNPNLTWSYMFGLLEESASKLDIVDYSLSQTTLEQVFINFAKYQRPELPKLASITGASGELFTAVSHLKNLVDVERQLFDYLKLYVSEEQKKLNRIKTLFEKSRYLLQLDTSNQTIVSRYVGNPINSFLILKRLLKFGTEIETLIDIDFSRDLVTKLHKYKSLFPSEDDVRGAQVALLRLQQTYNLSPATFSDGLAPNASTASQMNAEDAFAIGKVAYNNEDFVEAEMWMTESVRLLNIGRRADNKTTPDESFKFEVLDYLAWAEYSNRKFENAIKHTHQLLHIDPGNERLISNIELYQSYLRDARTHAKIKLKFSAKQKKRTKRAAKERRKFPKFYYTSDEDHYQRYLLEKVLAKSLCRGETKPVARKHHKKLLCWYKKSHPRLFLKPAKVERIYVKPEILLFRNVAEDKDLQRIKDVALPMLSRATVHNPQTGKIEHAKYRISKSAWLDKTDDPLVGEFDKRIEALTGLNMAHAETLQVANYGIGGHYDTHFDFSRSVPIRPPPFRRNTNESTQRSTHETKNELSLHSGERIATFLLYMTDVEMGGGTVFTNIHQQIRPSKGDAVFWFNLNHDGTGDYNTRHAACPVLLGEKWVANKWIREFGQEFRRRCALKQYQDDEV
eukprot:gene17572-19324_t